MEKIAACHVLTHNRTRIFYMLLEIRYKRHSTQGNSQQWTEKTL